MKLTTKKSIKKGDSVRRIYAHQESDRLCAEFQIMRSANIITA